MSFWTLILGLAATAAFASEPAAEPARLSLPDASGEAQSLEQFRGRIVVLNFWATWCVPCREEMPILSKIQERYGDDRVVVVGASADDESTQAKIAPFVEEVGIRFPIWMDATTADMERLGLGAALPATAILDRDGRIIFRVLGILERETLTARIDYLLAGGLGEAPERTIDTFSQAMHEHEGHDHAEEEHTHGTVGVEGASMVPS